MSKDIIIGIVGSRRRTDEANVRNLVRELHAKYGDSLILCSGGCRGVDIWAEDEAVKLGIRFKVFLPNFSRVRKNYFSIAKRYFQRNRKIARFAKDGIYAFVAQDRTGGTENTIMWANKYGRKVIIK